MRAALNNGGIDPIGRLQLGKIIVLIGNLSPES